MMVEYWKYINITKLCKRPYKLFVCHNTQYPLSLLSKLFGDWSTVFCYMITLCWFDIQGTMCASKRVRISWLWHCLSIPLYTISWSEPFSRHTLYSCNMYILMSVYVLESRKIPILRLSLLPFLDLQSFKTLRKRIV